MPVADRFPGTPWGEEALLSLANHYQKDALDDGAAPWWRRLLAEYPDGRYAERAAWRAGWVDYRAGRFQEAAQTFETTAQASSRRHAPPRACSTGRAARSSRSARTSAARALFRETVERYKNAYHGVRAQDALARMGGVVAPPPVLDGRGARARAPAARAARQPRPPAAADRPAGRGGRRSCGCCPTTPRVTATVAWVDWQRGRLRPAITAMKRAYPEWVGEAGDRLPREVWQVLFPIRYDQELRRGGPRGRPRPGARRRAHPAGVELRPGRPEPRRARAA